MKKTISVLLLVMMLCGITGAVMAEGADAFTYGVSSYFVNSDGDYLHYRLFVPQAETGKTYPLVMVLHGGGLNSSLDNGSQLGDMTDSFVTEEAQSKNPCYVVAPKKVNWWDGAGLSKMINEIMEEYGNVDANRIYVVGGSLGGWGAYEALIADPELYTGALMMYPSISRQYDWWNETFVMTEEMIPYLSHLKLWFIQGAKDPLVPPANNEYIIEMMQKAGMDVKYTLVEDAEHGFWVTEYEETAGAVDWLFEQSK